MTFFWSEIGSGLREQGNTRPPRIPRSNQSPEDLYTTVSTREWSIRNCQLKLNWYSPQGEGDDQYHTMI